MAVGGGKNSLRCIHMHLKDSLIRSHRYFFAQSSISVKAFLPMTADVVVPITDFGKLSA